MTADAESQILALQPERISDAQVTQVLSRAPAPRVLCFQGSPAFVTMAPFAEFLIAMGYPEAQLRNPRDGKLSYSGRLDSNQVAGMIAWYYERDGMMPMLIGHSRGGLLVIRTLYRLAESPATAIPLRNPLTDAEEPPAPIHDPLASLERPVSGLQVSYAAVIATGKLPRVLLGQWGDLSRLRRIPASVIDFTGFHIRFDLIAGTFSDPEPYRALGANHVRNVLLPAATSHTGLPRTRHLADNALTRAWISDYTPGTTVPPPGAPGIDTSNILHAADIWFSVKKHWCLQAQRLIRAGRAAAGGES